MSRLVGNALLKGVWQNVAKLNSTPEKMKTFQSDKFYYKKKLEAQGCSF